MHDPFRIVSIALWPVDIPLTDPFVVATGSRVVAQNAFVRITLADGSEGIGELAPFPEVSGETRDGSLARATTLAGELVGRSAHHLRALAAQMAEQAYDAPAARCGLETALFDAWCHAAKVPLWSLWGGRDVRPYQTDISVPITTADDTLRLAKGWYTRGFRLFKMKVGHDVDQDIARLEAVHRAWPDISFILDANQGYSREQAAAAVKGLLRVGARIVLLEQPVVREDLESMAALERDWNIPVAADESVRSVEDVRAVIAARAAGFVNIKITKTGVCAALDIATMVRGAGLRLMIGGMVETRIAMGCSFAMVMGLGGFEVLDLDTPLLLANDPVEGGYQYRGAELLPWDGPGLASKLTVPADAIVIT